MPSKGKLKKSLRRRSTPLMIAGNRWELLELTPKLNKKFLKMLGEKRPNITLRGFCDYGDKRIYLRPGQNKQDEGNTLLHEGLHALLWEIGCVHDLVGVGRNEKTVSALTNEILSYCKQTFIMPA
jgi:hypothetical protein